MSAQAQPATCEECTLDAAHFSIYRKERTKLCPRHAQVAALLKALEWALPWLKKVPLPTSDQEFRDRFASELEQARAAIAATKGGAA